MRKIEQSVTRQFRFVGNEALASYKEPEVSSGAGGNITCRVALKNQATQIN